MEDKNRLSYLDGLRALAALSVIFTHAFFCVWHGGGYGGGAKYIYHSLLGSTAVLLFIVLSGFCLTLPITQTLRLSRGPSDFFRRRAQRILPPYFACLLLSIMLIREVIGPDPDTLWEQSGILTWHGVWTHLLLIQDITGDRTINYPLWTIAVEWHIYFLFPLLLWAWRRWGLIAPNLIIVALSLAGYHLVYKTPYAEGSPQFAGLFALGAWAAAAPTLPRRSVLISLVLLIPLLGLQAANRLISHPELYGLWTLAIGAAFALLIGGLAKQPTHWLRRALSWRPLVAIGTMSYSVYLLHAPLLEVVCRRFLFPFQAGMMARDHLISSMESFWLLVVLGIPVILLWSLLFYLAIEKPSHRFKIPSRSPKVLLQP